MSIVAQIERIANNVSNAYNAISDAGGTLPETRNTDNLEAAIRSIPTISEETTPALINEASGNPIVLTDSLDKKLWGMKVFGKTAQNTTTGKNLLPNNATTQTIFGVKFTVNSDGVITVNGTAEGYADLYVYGQVNDNGSYLVIPKGSKFVGAENAASNPFWIFREKTKGNIYNVHNINPLLAERDCYFYGICFRVSPNVTVSDFRTAPMFCVASSDDTYEPYTGGIPSPNPEYPQPLVSAGDGGSLGVTVAGKNLFYIPAGKTVTSRGVTITAQADGSLLANGTKTEAAECPIYYFVDSPTLFAGKTITLRSDRTDIRIQMNVTTKDGQISYLNVRNGTRTIVIPEDTVKFGWQISLDGLNTYDNYVIYPYAVIGTEVGNWEPYAQPQVLTASTPNGLPGIPVTSGGNYTDENGQQWVCDEVDFGRGVYMKRIFGTVFKNAAEWRIAGTKNGLKRFYTNQFMGVIKNAKDNATKECALCSHFINVTASDTWNEVTGISVNSKGRLDIYYSGIEQTTAALEVYFSSNPVAFMAELATPIETPLSAEELAAYAALHTNDPTTTISNDAGAYMEVTYVADTKRYIDNKFAELATAIVNN